jgi:mRNA-degrading endonuclease RelE of RelBE toxin-antitoxin system
VGHDDTPSQSYRVALLARARREFVALPKDVQRQLGTAINDLGNNPRPVNAKLLTAC